MAEPFKRIALTQGKFALVSPEDFDELNQFKWYANKIGSIFYAMRNTKGTDGKWRSERMHRRILKPVGGKEVDHINGDGLDNRRSNLRIATHAENIRNRKLNSNSTSGYKGVSKRWNRWRARIKHNGVEYFIGHFDSPEAAAEAYNLKAIELHGEFAKLNRIL